MKKIKLSQGRVAFVDDDIFNELNQFKWSACRTHNVFYASRNEILGDGLRRRRLMHHCVAGVPQRGFVTDHKDGNGLNNQRENLQIVTNRENVSNQKRKKEGKLSSKFVGISWDKHNRRWKAAIKFDGKCHHLGMFADEHRASKAYQSALANLKSRSNCNG